MITSYDGRLEWSSVSVTDDDRRQRMMRMLSREVLANLDRQSTSNHRLACLHR